MSQKEALTSSDAMNVPAADVILSHHCISQVRPKTTNGNEHCSSSHVVLDNVDTGKAQGRQVGPKSFYSKGQDQAGIDRPYRTHAP